MAGVRSLVRDEAVDLAGATGFFLYSSDRVGGPNSIMWVRLRNGETVWINANTGRFSTYSLLHESDPLDPDLVMDVGL